MTTAKHRPSENTPAEQNEILTSSESEPERRRRENISANLQILTELGLTQGGLVVKKNSEHEVTWANDRPKKKKKNGRSYMKLSSRNPSRVSRRLKGEPPAFTHTLDDDFVNKDDQPIPTTMTTGKTRRGTRSLWWSTKQTTGLVTTCEVPDCIEVPLTLGENLRLFWICGIICVSVIV
ncbi:hypothetical protein BC936DRAFT_150155 [Jimgerdemannia flammicorona]|uniref:Uncharacterized protein n=1 Tax=Jimgerdemannia flammicorona TaxID=994334 RepID=A0A433DK10_9FUNG|nr:hypothetical protein BC936DRAFT_150155 [Jimgerdemannia flammicorona]